MNCKALCAVIVLVSSSVFAQVVPPAGHSADWQLGYEQGYADATVAAFPVAATQPAGPAWPADVVYHPDKTYHIAPTGMDKLSDGSEGRPFATISRALQQIHSDRAGPNSPKLAEIAYQAGGTYTQAQWIGENDLLIDAYGQKNPEDRPVILSSDVAFGSLHGHGIHLQNLRVVAASNGGHYAIYANGVNDLTCDYCEFANFNLNVALIGGSGFRFWHNFVARSCAPNNARSQGLYTEGADKPDVQCNVIYHNGWDEKTLNLTDPAQTWPIQQNHGWYESVANGSIGGIDRFNIYIDNAATGHQARPGGTVMWSVFQSNGSAKDVFVAGAQGEIANCVVFGPTGVGPYWGGGFMGQSVNASIHDCLVASGPSQEQDAAVTIYWDAQGAGPLPANTVATVSNISGIWPNDAISLQSGRTATTTNITVRKPNPEEHVPSLLDCFGTKDDDATAELLRTHLHDPKYSAQAIIEWAHKSLDGK